MATPSHLLFSHILVSFIHKARQTGHRSLCNWNRHCATVVDHCRLATAARAPPGRGLDQDLCLVAKRTQLRQSALAAQQVAEWRELASTSSSKWCWLTAANCGQQEKLNAEGTLKEFSFVKSCLKNIIIFVTVCTKMIKIAE